MRSGTRHSPSLSLSAVTALTDVTEAQEQMGGGLHARWSDLRNMFGIPDLLWQSSGNPSHSFMSFTPTLSRLSPRSQS